MFFGYCRYSTARQGEPGSTTIEEQERVIRAVAMARGVDKMDVEIYKDEAVSGAVPLRFRPEGKKLIRDIKAGDVVCAAKLDRMFRSAVNALETAEYFKANGIGLILPEFGFEPITDSSAAKLFFGMLALVADFERSVINDRIRTGKAAKKLKGGHTGGTAPYGYRQVGARRDARLEPDDREQQIVQLVNRLNREGQPLAAICRRLARDGHKTRTGRDFVIEQVQRIVCRARVQRGMM